MKKLSIVVVAALLLFSAVLWWRHTYAPSARIGQNVPVSLSSINHEDEEYHSEAQRLLEKAPGTYIAEPDFDAIFLSDLHEVFIQEDVAMPDLQRLATHAPMILLSIAKTYATGDCTMLEDIASDIDSRSISRFCFQVRNMRSMTISNRYVKNDTASNVITYVKSLDVPLLPEGNTALPSGFEARFNEVQSIALMDLVVSVENADPVSHRFYLVDTGETIKLLDLVSQIEGRILFRGDSVPPPIPQDDNDPATQESVDRLGQS